MANQRAGFRDLALADLPDHDVLVEVRFSTLNYKDGLAVSGKGRIARRLPMVAGVDLSGIVVESRNPDWKPGEKIIVNGWGMSETEWGGYTRFQRVKAEWLTRLPDAFTLEESMAIGTAGYTAALAIDALEAWGRIRTDQREILVTGAAGGVGSVAITLLAERGYKVTASTGRPETHDYLSDLGATGFVDRAELAAKGTALQRERWAGAIDSVGSTTLANVLAQTVQSGAVAACGLAGGADLPATRHAAYPARRRPDRHQFGHRPACRTRPGLGHPSRKPRPQTAGRDDHGGTTIEPATTGRRHPCRKNPRPRGHRRHEIGKSDDRVPPPRATRSCEWPPV